MKKKRDRFHPTYIAKYLSELYGRSFNGDIFNSLTQDELKVAYTCLSEMCLHLENVMHLRSDDDNAL